jgi:hypothetical protein
MGRRAEIVALGRLAARLDLVRVQWRLCRELYPDQIQADSDAIGVAQHRLGAGEPSRSSPRAAPSSTGRAWSAMSLLGLCA